MRRPSAGDVAWNQPNPPRPIVPIRPLEPLRSRSRFPPSSSLRACPSCGSGTARRLPQLSLFLGRFHPTLLHLPVALLLLALLLEMIRLPGLARVAPSFPALVLDSVLWLAALSGLAAAVAGWLLSHEGGYDGRLLESAPLERRRHRHRRLRVRGAAIAGQRAAGPHGAPAAGDRVRRDHVRHDDRRRPRRRQPDARRGLPDGARAGADPSPGGSSHPSRSLDRASHAGRRSSGLRRRGPAHLRTALHLVPQPRQAQRRPEAGHACGSPGWRSVRAGGDRGDARGERASEACASSRRRQEAHAAEGTAAPERRRVGRAGLVGRGWCSRCGNAPDIEGASRDPRRVLEDASGGGAAGGRGASSSARLPSTRPRSRPCGRRFPDRCGRSCPESATSSTRRRSPERPSVMPSSRSWRRRAPI